MTERTGQMDSADADPDRLLRALSNQGARLGQHEQLLHGLMESHQAAAVQITQLNTMLQELTTNLTRSAAPGQPTLTQPPASAQPQPPLPQPRETHVPDPEHYTGDMGKCGGFLLQCSLVFTQKPVTYASDSSKVAFIMGLLKGRALDWAAAKWQNNPEIRNNFSAFEEELRRVFDHPVQGREASKRLLTLHQGNRSVADYSVEFRTLAAETGWDDLALQSVFLNGLSEQLKDELALKDDSDNLDSMISTAIKMDNRLRERRRERASRQPSNTFCRSVPAQTSSVPTVPTQEPSGQTHQNTELEPMQVGRARLTPTERMRRIKAGVCIYCGQMGHFLATCPARPKDGAHQ